MQLEFIQDVNNYGEDIVRLYGFDSAQAKKFKTAVDKLITDGNYITLSTLAFIEPINCDLTLRIADTDEGIMRINKNNFVCDLTKASYEAMSKLIEPFCKKESRGFQLLYDLDIPIDFLFSPGGNKV